MFWVSNVLRRTNFVYTALITNISSPKFSTPASGSSTWLRLEWWDGPPAAVAPRHSECVKELTLRMQLAMGWGGLLSTAIIYTLFVRPVESNRNTKIIIWKIKTSSIISYRHMLLCPILSTFKDAERQAGWRTLIPLLRVIMVDGGENNRLTWHKQQTHEKKTL
jgi:hypothetical protein